MATQHEASPKSPALRKYEQYVTLQLQKATRLVRRADLLLALLVLALGSLLFAGALLSLDLWLGLSVEVRLFALAGYGLVVLGYAGYQLYGLLAQRVNPYYAAKKLEDTLANPKDSVINWLDLQEEPLPPAVRTALSARAAKDLSQADVDQAVSSRGPVWVGAAVALGAAILLVWWLRSPEQFQSLLARTFLPFREIEIAVETAIKILQPQPASLAVPLQQKVAFRVEISGRAPRAGTLAAPRLHYRYSPRDSYIEKPLDSEDDGTWTTVLVPDQVQTGFWYRFQAGDAVTAEHQVTVVALPQIVRWEITYEKRPYFAQPPQQVVYPNEHAVFPQIREYQGTKVIVKAFANRDVRSGRLDLEIDGKVQGLEGQRFADDPKALQFAFTLQKSGVFRVGFVTTNSETSQERTAYPLLVHTDQAPLVELSKPGKDGTLPANGTLQLEGNARDDIGIVRMVLQLKLLKGAAPPVELQGKLYRAGKSFKLVDGSYPDQLEYKDFVALEKLQDADGKPFAVKQGMEIEYWLKATDNSDYPQPKGNVGRSQSYKLLIGAPEKEQEKVAQQREDAAKDQGEHQQQQDRQLEQRNQQAQQKLDERNPPSAKQLEQQKKDLQDKLNKLQDAAKEPPPSPSTAKDNKANDEQAQPAAKPAEQGQNEPKPSQPKDAGQAEPPPAQNQAKDDGQPQEKPAPKSAPKNEGAPMPQAGKGEAKDAGKEQRPETQAKDAPRESKVPPAEPKKGAEPQAAQEPQNTAAKQGGQPDGEQKNAQAKQGEPKEQPAAPPKQGEPKGQPNAKDQPQAPQEKSGRSASKEGAPQQGEPGSAKDSKDEPKQGGEPNAKPAAAKGEPTGNKDATLDDVAKLKQQLEQPEQRQEALEKLDQLSKDARKPEVRQAAKDAKQQAGQPNEPMAQQNQQPGSGERKLNPEELAKLRKDLEQPENQEKLRQELERLSKDAKDPETRKGAEEMLKRWNEQLEQAAKQQASAKASSQPMPKPPMGQGKEGTLEDVAKHKQDLARPEKRKEALEKLDDLARNAREEAVREAARKAKQQAGQGNDTGKQTPMNTGMDPKNPMGQEPMPGEKGKEEKLTPEEIAQLKKDLEKPENREKLWNELKRLSEKAEDPEVRKGAQEMLGRWRQRLDDIARQMGEHQSDPAAQKPADPELAKRAGDLQLEELRKKLTPDVLKKLNWSEADAAKFMREAADYQRRLGQQQAKQPAPPRQPGTASSQLPSQGVRQVGEGTPSTSTVDGNRYVVPPEFREAHRVFTGGENKTPAPR